MDESHKKLIDKHMTALVNDMDALSIAINLQSKHLFFDNDVDTIMAERTAVECRRRLLVLVKTKGNTAFKLFVEALQETNQKHLTDLLAGNPATVALDSRPSINLYHGIQKVLKEKYSYRFKKIRPFSLPFTFDIENTWVSLALREDAKQSQNTEDHAELLNSAFCKEKLLIIEGKPATGKTSLMRRLAYEWATGKNAWHRLIRERITGKGLSLYDLVVYAQFRDVREQEFESIADLVIEYNKKYMEKDEVESLSSLLHNKKYIERKRILILLDGYDESSLDKQCKELTEYLTATTIRKEVLFNIVITTRPGYLGQHRENNARYIYADVLGFITNEQKEKYISNHFNSFNTDNKENIAAVYQLLQRNENMNKLAETPLFLTFICLVHERIVDGTVLELYCNIIWWLIDRHQKDFSDRNIPILFEFQGNSDKDKFEIIQDYYHQFPQLHCLGKMGLHNLKKDIFDESDCQQFNLKEILQQVGLLRKDKFYDGHFCLTTSYSFPHRTIQEFIAALFFFCSKEELDLCAHKEAALDPKLDTNDMTQYQDFLLQIALSNALPIWPTKSNTYFESITNIEIDLSFHAFNTTNGLNSKLLNAIFSQCKNVQSIRVNRYRKLYPSTALTKISASTLILNKLLYLRKVAFYKCTFEANSQLSFKSCSALNRIKFDECTLQHSKIDFADLSTIDNLEFRNCILEVNSQLSFKKCLALKIMVFRYCVIKLGCIMNIETTTGIDTLAFHYCIIDLEAWQSITEEIKKSSVKCLKLSFNGGDFNHEYVDQWQKCNNASIEMEIKEYTLRSNDHLSFSSPKNLHSLSFQQSSFDFNSQLSIENYPALKLMKFFECRLKRSIFNFSDLPVIDSLAFEKCTFDAISQLSLKDCPVLNSIKLHECRIKCGSTISIGTSTAIATLKFDNCNIDLEAWQSITEEIRNSSVKHLKLSYKGKDFNNEYARQLQKCKNVVIEIKLNLYAASSNDHLSFNNLMNLHSLTFWRCCFKDNVQVCLKDCPSITTLNFEYCNIHLEAWQLITDEIRTSSVKYLNLIFEGEDFNNELVNQLQICENVIIQMRIYKYIIRPNGFFSFNIGKSLHSLTFRDCSFAAYSKLSFINCSGLKHLTLSNCKIDLSHDISIGTSTEIGILEYIKCNINGGAWQSITEELANSSVKCLKFTSDSAKYLELVQKCNNIKEIYIINPCGVEFKDCEYEIVQQLIKLTQNMLSLKRIVFDFTIGKGQLKESNKELIEIAGQKRDSTFTVSIIPCEIGEGEGDNDNDNDR